MKPPLLVSLGCAIVAFAIGYFVADNSAEISKLQSELAQARRASLSVANPRERSAARVPVEPPEVALVDRLGVVQRALAN